MGRIKPPGLDSSDIVGWLGVGIILSARDDLCFVCLIDRYEGGITAARSDLQVGDLCSLGDWCLQGWTRQAA